MTYGISMPPCALVRTLSAGHAHDLRAASDLSRATYQQMVRAVTEREQLDRAARELLAVTAESGSRQQWFPAADRRHAAGRGTQSVSCAPPSGAALA